MSRETRSTRFGFTLVELLVVVAVIAMLLSIMLPGLARASAAACSVKCAGNLHQLGHAFHMYAGEYRGRAMPLANTAPGSITYWYGRECGAAGVDPTRGLTWPYLRSDLKSAGVYECPEQPVGTIDELQGNPAGAGFTSTYGYNGYYLTPAHTPGWSWTIGDRPWQTVDTLERPASVFVFADTMIDWGGNLKNCALLDPPKIYDGRGGWSLNDNPTTSFRHDWLANVVFADGHVDSVAANPELVTSQQHRIGSAGRDNGPHYVPDWEEW